MVSALETINTVFRNFSNGYTHYGVYFLRTDVLCLQLTRAADGAMVGHPAQAAVLRAGPDQILWIDRSLQGTDDWRSPMVILCRSDADHDAADARLNRLMSLVGYLTRRPVSLAARGPAEELITATTRISHSPIPYQYPGVVAVPLQPALDAVRFASLADQDYGALAYYRQASLAGSVYSEYLTLWHVLESYYGRAQTGASLETYINTEAAGLSAFASWQPQDVTRSIFANLNDTRNLCAHIVLDVGGGVTVSRNPDDPTHERAVVRDIPLLRALAEHAIDQRPAFYP